MLRKDLRGEKELRQLTVELGLVTEADGSAAVSMGATKVIASLTGPTQPKFGRHELHDKACIEIEVQIPTKTIVDGMDVMQQKKRYERFLKDSLEGCIDIAQFPRMLLLFNVMVVCNDGALMSTAVNACVLAALDAGLPMFFVPTAVSICTFVKDNKAAVLILDPTASEEKESTAKCTIVVRQPAPGEEENGVNFVASECAGLLSLDAYSEVNDLAAQTSVTLHSSMRQFMEAKLCSDV
jgi:ribonuclease PH